MRKYWMFAKSSMQISAAYSAWYWASMATVILKLLIMFYFWHAVYQNQSSIGQLNLKDMLTYIIVAMFVQGFVSGAGNELAREIKQGQIAVELMRPYDYLFKMIFMDFGQKASFFIRETIPMGLIAFLVIQINPPGSLVQFLLFLASAAFGLWIGTFFDMLIGILAFWTVNIWGVQVLKEGVITFFSGALIPITLFPAWLQSISFALPFQAMVFSPVAIYTGQITGTDVYWTIAVQAAWAAALYILLKVLWNQAIKKVTIFGG
ncbi:ABC-2 family transporter protein [Metabacillus sp. KIGAM252]|uniref:ABC-2 family transporter protein n=1 Tax=Metabacillus flavus TaxID=2823519 RepID=A0ABS5LEW0_9BACI|nr:ABC-2 family transporter protein [Metabacillus flavus]MBS2969282.1 ABC-2 family transporter protein [Metabacillus flavus]